MSTKRSSQPLIAFRATERLAKQFKDWCSLEGMSQQVVLQTVIQALVDDDLPNLRELRIKQASAREQSAEE